jgi:chemotaxis receptor (MCP) glutamine deamidase CheD
MTLEEIFRRIVRGHLLILAVCLITPVLITVLTLRQQPAAWEAEVRIQVGETAPSSAVQAEAISSRVLALATTPQFVGASIKAAGVTRGVREVADHRVTVVRLGTSSIVGLRVTDPDRKVAGMLVDQLASRVVSFMNQGTRHAYDAALAAIDTEITTASKERDALRKKLDGTADAIRQQLLSAQIGAVEEGIQQLASQRAELVTSDANRDTTVIVDDGAPQVTAAPTTLPTRAALALVLGLALGLVFAVGLESLRPRTAGLPALARQLGAPVLGTGRTERSELFSAITLAARRQDVDTVVLLGVDQHDEGRLVSLLETAPSVPVRMPETPGIASVGHGSVVFSLPAPRPSEPGVVRVTSLSGVLPHEEESAGIVVVGSGVSRQSDVEALRGLTTLLRWPVLGIVGSQRIKPRWWRRTRRMRGRRGK